MKRYELLKKRREVQETLEPTGNQEKIVLKMLRAGKTVSRFTVRPYGIERLSDRIFKLKARGFKIDTIMIRKNNKNFANYKLGA